MLNVSPQASTLYAHYLELRKMREHRLKLLQDHQKRVQQHERSLFKIRNHLAQVLTELAQVHEKLDHLIESNIWVTAQEHEQIHNVCQVVSKEYNDWNLKKQNKHKAIDQEAKDARLHASHVIGIERALLCLEDQMRQQFPHYTDNSKRSNPLAIMKQAEQLDRIFLRRSQSQLSFTSIVTATSKNSTSLSGSLLKKWLKPRLQEPTMQRQEQFTV